MMGLIEQVLKGQHQAYSSVILLSATLPRNLKEKLLSTYKGQSASNAYPLISHTDLLGKTQEFTLPEQATNKTVTIETWCSVDLLPTNTQLQKINDWVVQGAMVGVICNTVKDAQRLYQQMSNSYPDLVIDLFHARYTFSDRKKLEDKALNDYGKQAQRSGRLLIATQVIEQSLDLDFDVLISQIAPIEFLMQRMGRLWRHDRINTELYPRSNVIKSPLFITLLPSKKITEDTTIEQLKQHYQGSGYVYQNTRLLYRTEQYLQTIDQLKFPDCYRDAIDSVHDEQAVTGEPRILATVFDEYSIKSDGNNYTARSLSSLQSKPLNDVDPRCALLTRDGEMSATVVLFNSDNELLHGGDFNEQQDRENNTVALARKHAQGQKDENYYCYKAIVGKDIIYNKMGVITADLID